jgi:hypothetical protein
MLEENQTSTTSELSGSELFGNEIEQVNKFY